MTGTNTDPATVGDEEIGAAMDWLIPAFDSIRPPRIARFDWAHGQAIFALRELDHYRAKAKPGESFTVRIPGDRGMILRVRVGPGLVLGYLDGEDDPAFEWKKGQ